MNWMPGVAASIASVDLLLWENLTWLDPEDLSNPLSHQDRRGRHASWQGELQSEGDSWTDGSSEIHSTEDDWTRNNFSLATLSWFQIIPLPLVISCMSFHLLQGVQSHDCSSFNVVVMKKETRSSSRHQMTAITLTDKLKKKLLVSCFPFSLRARRQAFIPHWEFFISPSKPHRTERQVSFVSLLHS